MDGDGIVIIGETIQSNIVEFASDYSVAMAAAFLIFRLTLAKN